MVTYVDKHQTTFKNSQPDKRTEWQWIRYDELILKDNLSIANKMLVEKGYDNLSLIKKTFGFI